MPDSVAARPRAKRVVVDHDIAFRLRLRPGDDPRQGRLARSEDAGDAEDLPFPEFQRDIAEMTGLGNAVGAERDGRRRLTLDRLTIIFGVSLTADDQFVQHDLVDRRRQPLVDDAAVLQRDDLVAGREDIRQAMRHQHEGGALAPALDTVEELGGFVVGERAGRFVEQDDRLDRIDAAEGEGLGDLDKLALAERQRSGQRRRADRNTEFLEHRPRLGDHRLLAQYTGDGEFVLATEEDVFEDRQGRDQSLLLEDRRHAVARRLGRMAEAHRIAADRDRTGVGPHGAVDD